MAAAVNRLIEIGGGFVASVGGKVMAELALPLAGLMSDRPFEAVREELMHAARGGASLGCTLPEPFLQVAFLPLPVIPHLKITDKGLFDVDKFEFVSSEHSEGPHARRKRVVLRCAQDDGAPPQLAPPYASTAVHRQESRQ